MLRTYEARSISGVLLLMPFDVATKAWYLVRVDRAAVQQGIDSIAEITPRDRDVVARAAIIKLTAIDKLAFFVE